MFLRLLLLLTAVPLVEVMILFWIARLVTWQGTIALIVGTGLVGAWLARKEGLRTLSRIRAELHAGGMPAATLLDAALILIAGAFLVTPGVLTDLTGFALLVPPVRAWIRRRLRAWLESRIIRVDDGHPAPFVDVSAHVRDADFDTAHGEDGNSPGDNVP